MESRRTGSQAETGESGVGLGCVCVTGLRGINDTPGRDTGGRARGASLLGCERLSTLEHYSAPRYTVYQLMPFPEALPHAGK